MRKQEFLDRLRSSLSGRVSAAVVNDNLNYYEDYINMEIRKGKSEEEVLSALGDPRLIAKTIIQTNGGETGGLRYDAQDGSDYRQEYGQDYEQFQSSSRRSFRIPAWLLAIIVILVTVLIFSVVFSILSFLAPVILALAGVLLLVKIFRDWLN